MKILVLGVTGMLGNAVFRMFQADDQHETWGTMRSHAAVQHFEPQSHTRLITGLDVLDQDALAATLARVRPELVINCVGLIKQLSDANDPLTALPINAMLPHRLARLCELLGSRMIHVSTDCVFSGSKGGYQETDFSDAEDLYGKSKYIGEVHDQSHVITLRTSIIGHELDSARSLIGWFLSQQSGVKGYTRAIFSGLPTCELARVIRDIVLPRQYLHGLYHVAAAPISKYELLQLVNKEYGKGLEIMADDGFKIDRSLNAGRFREATGYMAPSWPQLVALMRSFQ